MDLDEILKTFRDRVVELEQFRTVAEETTKQEFARYADYVPRRSGQPRRRPPSLHEQ